MTTGKIGTAFKIELYMLQYRLIAVSYSPKGIKSMQISKDILMIQWFDYISKLSLKKKFQNIQFCILMDEDIMETHALLSNKSFR